MQLTPFSKGTGDLFGLQQVQSLLSDRMHSPLCVRWRLGCGDFECHRLTILGSIWWWHILAVGCKEQCYFFFISVFMMDMLTGFRLCVTGSELLRMELASRFLTLSQLWISGWRWCLELELTPSGRSGLLPIFPRLPSGGKIMAAHWRLMKDLVSVLRSVHSG